jgi:hypothetical protein
MHLLLCKRVHLRAVGWPRQYKYRVNGEWATSPCEPITGDGSVRPTRKALQGIQPPCYLRVAISTVATRLWHACRAAGMHCHSNVPLEEHNMRHVAPTWEVSSLR